MKNTQYNPFLILIHSLCLFVLAYTFIIRGIFSNTETLSSHMKQAGLYADISEIVKYEISTRVAERYQDRIVLRALTDKLLDAIVTPQFIEQRSQRALKVATKITAQPLDIADNTIVVSTTEYKEKVSKELESRQLPEVVAPTVQNLVAAVPEKVTLVNMEKRPNSILEFLTRAKLLYERINLGHVLAVVAGIITGALLIFFNVANVRTLFKALATAYLIAGTLVLVGSYLFPFFVTVTNEGPNPYLNKFVSDAANYLFAETRLPSLIYLGLGGIFYVLFRWSYTDTLFSSLTFTKKKGGE